MKNNFINDFYVEVFLKYNSFPYLVLNYDFNI